MLSFTLIALVAVAAAHASRGSHYHDDDDDSCSPCIRKGYGDKGRDKSCEKQLPYDEEHVIEFESNDSAFLEIQDPTVTRRERAVLIQNNLETFIPTAVILPLSESGAPPRAIIRRSGLEVTISLQFLFFRTANTSGVENQPLWATFSKTGVSHLMPPDLGFPQFNPAEPLWILNLSVTGTGRSHIGAVGFCCQDDDQTPRVHMQIYPGPEIDPFVRFQGPQFAADGFTAGATYAIPQKTMSWRLNKLPIFISNSVASASASTQNASPGLLATQEQQILPF